MKVLVACEFSQVVCKAFRDKGHEAYSCDLLPCKDNFEWHIQDDVLKHLEDGWDMMIAHPPCTYLSYAGTRHWNKPGRFELREKAMDFFLTLVNAPIEKIAIENPLGLPCQRYRKPDQVIHPYFFGERQMKRTCLWLKNLPKLYWRPCDDLFGKRTMTEKPEPISIDATPRHKRHYFTDAKIRNPQLRSITFQSIANAMAEQWG